LAARVLSPPAGNVGNVTSGLFDAAWAEAEAKVAPLAVRMRPRTLDEVVGQSHQTDPR